MNLTLLQEKLSEKDQQQLRNHAHRQAATAVVAYRYGFKVEALSLGDDEIWIMKSLTMLDIAGLDDEIKISLAAPVAHCVMKGEKTISQEERSLVQRAIARIYQYDRSTPEGRKAASTMYDDLWDIVLQLLIDPKVFGQVDAIALRLTKEGKLNQKDIESIIKDAHPALPPKDCVYDW